MKTPITNHPHIINERMRQAFSSPRGWHVGISVALAILAFVLCLSNARAVEINFDSSEGYSTTGGNEGTGSLDGQPSTVGATTWAGNGGTDAVYGSGILVEAGAGIGGSQAAVAPANTDGVANYAFSPTNADLGGAFSSTSVVDFSFDLNWNTINPDSGTYTGLFFLGSDTGGTQPYALRLQWQADGDLLMLGTTGSAFAKNSLGNTFFATADTYYDISGVANYATDTVTLTVNGVTQAPLTFYNPVGTPNADILLSNQNSTGGNAWSIDNLQVGIAGVPEPSTSMLILGAIAAIATLQMMRRKMTKL